MVTQIDVELHLPIGTEEDVVPTGRDTEFRSLTKRQTEVLAYVAKGLTNAEIGRLLGCTKGTVKVHVANIIQRLNVSNRTEAASDWTRSSAEKLQNDKA